MSTAHFLNRLDEIDYWRALHKFPRVSGAYSKPEEFPSPGGFSSTNRESKCWRYATTYNHTASKKTSADPARTAFHYGLEISGIRVGVCNKIESARDKTTLTGFISMDDLGYLAKWDSPTAVTIYTYSRDGTPSIRYELPKAEIFHKWLGRLEITHSPKRTVRL